MNTAVVYPKWRTAWETNRWHVDNETPYIETTNGTYLSAVEGNRLKETKNLQPSDFKLLTRDKWLHKLIKAAHDAIEYPTNSSIWYNPLKEAYKEYSLS